MKIRKSKQEKKPIPEEKRKEINETSETVAEAHVEITAEREEPAVEDRISELETELAELGEKLKFEQGKCLRVQADYDNFRKRITAEFNQIITGAGERIITQMLPVMDDFERLFNHDSENVEKKALQHGVDLIYKKFQAVLNAEGLKPIEALGKPFDTGEHAALAQVEDSSKPDGTVIDEVEKGYRLGNKIIRYSKVIVNKIPEADAPVSDNSETTEERPDE
ncbi:nucleotide exchange factor GrpE [bacterium]|nr:nucleotide exchange factor GrpE [bacterium]